MAIETIEQLRDRQARSGLPSITELRQRQKDELDSGVRDPALGYIPVTLQQEGTVGAAKRQVRERIMRDFYPGEDWKDIFGPGDPLSDQVWGEIIRKQDGQIDADGALETLYTVELGFSPEQAYLQRDLITETLFGKPLRSDGALGKISDAYRNGQIQVQLSDLGLDVLMGRDTVGTWQEIDRLRKAMRPDFPSEMSTWWVNMLAATAEQLPLMGETLEAAPFGAIAGAAGGLAAGVTVGAASPTIGEESLIPSMVWGGMKMGAGLAGAWRVGQMESGGILLDMLDAGVDPGIAKAACVGVGVLNGFLELGQIQTLFLTLPGGRSLLKRATGGVAKRILADGTFRKLAAEHAVRFGGYLGAETVQELAQESVSVTAEQLGAWLTNELGGQAERQTIDEIKARMMEVGTKSLQAFTVIGIPGSALSVGVDVAQMGKYSPREALLPDGRDTQIQVVVPSPEAAGEKTGRDGAKQAAQGEGPPTVTPAPAPPEATVAESATVPKESSLEGGRLPGGRQAGGTILFDPDEWARVIREGRKLFDEGADQFAEWSELMVRSAGEDIRPALKQIWDLAIQPTVEAKQEPVWEREPPQPAAAAAHDTGELEQALLDLSYEALAAKAKEIGLRVRGKKNQLAALIAEAIKAKAGPEIRRMATRNVKAKSGPQKGQKVPKQVQVVTTRIADKKALADVEKQIREHWVYQTYAQGAEYVEAGTSVALEDRTRVGRVDPDRVYFVEPEYRGEVEGYVGKRGAKGYNAKLAAHLTFDKEKGQAWDQAVQEQALDLDFSGFMASLAESLAAREKGPGGINEAALRQAVKADAVVAMLAEKRRMLREGASAYDINKALEKMGADAGLGRDLWEDLLLGGGVLMDPDDPHPGSMTIKEFRDRLGRELADKDSAWIRQWSLPGVPETPAAWHKRLKAEWQGIQAQQVAADLSLGELLKEETVLTAEQEAQINAIDAEKAADEIIQRERQTLFGQLFDSVFDEGAILRDLRGALKAAYRRGQAEAIAAAREAYRAQRQKIAARKQLREYAAKLLRIIKKPVGRSVALEQRQAIEALQAEIDPAFRSRRTLAEREASRRFFEEHPEAQAPAKVRQLIAAKSPSEMTIEEIEQIARAKIELWRKGRLIRNRQLEEQAAAREEDLAAVVNSLTAGKGLHLAGDRVIVRPPDETARQRWFNRYATTLTPERFLDWLDKGREYLGSVFKIFWERVAEAEAGKQAKIRQRVAATVAVLKRLGLTYKDLQAAALTVHDGTDLTVEQVVGAYNFMKNVSSQLAITYGNNLNRADQTNIQMYVEGRPEIKELADWIVEHYDEHYARLRQAVIDTEDRDMGREENYTPIRRMELDFTPDERQIMDELLQRAHFKKGYAEKGMTIMRQDIPAEYQKPIRLDGWTLLLEQIERQEHYIAMAKLVRDLQGILRDEGVRNALRERGGRETTQMLQRYVDVVGNPNIYRTYGQIERFCRLLRRNTAIAYLGLKISTMLKQPVSVFRMFPYAGMHLVRAGLDAATDWRRVRSLAVSKDPLLEQPALERELEEFKAANPAGYRDLYEKLGHSTMKGLIWMDGIGRTIGWYGVYLKEMAEHGDDARAVKQARLATSLTQAGARVFQLPELYRSASQFTLLLLQFTNECNKLWNIGTYDLPQMIRHGHYERAIGTVVGMGLEAGIMWMIANRRLPEDEADALDAVSDTAINMIPVFGPTLVAVLNDYGGGGVAGLEGPAQAAKELKDMGKQALDGTLGDGDILDSAHKMYRGLAPLAGVPYTGPRDVIRAMANENLLYLLGGPTVPKKGSTAGAYRPRRQGAGRGRGR